MHYTHIHTYIHIHVYTHIHIDIHAYIPHIYSQTCIQNIYIYTYIHTYSHIHTYIHINSYIPHIYTHAHIHTYTHIHIHTYTHTQQRPREHTQDGRGLQPREGVLGGNPPCQPHRLGPSSLQNWEKQVSFEAPHVWNSVRAD